MDMSVVDHESFAQALMVYAREEVARNQSLRAHPSPEKLAAYHADELSEAEDLEIQRHLAICSECPALLIDLEDLFEPRQRDLGLSDSWVASAWEDLRSRLGGKKERGGPPPQVKAPWWAWLSAVMRPAVLATAGMAVLCIGLATALMNLRESQSRPLVNPVTVEVRNERTRGVPEPPSVTLVPIVPSNDGMILDLDISPLEARQYEQFSGSIVDARGREAHPFPASPLLKGTNKLRITLDRKLLEPGVYTIKVFGVANGVARRQPVEELAIKIVHQGAPE